MPAALKTAGCRRRCSSMKSQARGRTAFLIRCSRSPAAEKFFTSLPNIDFSGVNRLPAASRSNDPGVGTAAMSGGFPPPPRLRSMWVRKSRCCERSRYPVFFSKGFRAVAKPVASAPENSFHTDTVPPIFADDALAALVTPIADSEASNAAAVAVTTARLPKNLTTLKIPPNPHQGRTL